MFRRGFSKRFLHKYYGLIALFSGMAFVIAACIQQQAWQMSMTVSTLILGFVYFCQKQALDDFNSFQGHFKDFNARYDALNDTLNGIVTHKPPTLDDDQIKVLNDYFILCAEEYYFYKNGMIYQEVWDSWRSGMQWFYKNDDRIRELWNRELDDNGSSYYGFGKEQLGFANSIGVAPKMRPNGG